MKHRVQLPELYAFNTHKERCFMLARIAMISGLVASICLGDNFLIKNGHNGESFFNMKDEKAAKSSHVASSEHERQSQEPMRVVVEDVNPNSELGQVLQYLMNDAKKRELAEAKAKAASKIAKKKPKPKPKIAKVQVAPQEHVMEMSQMPSGEAIKAKEAPVVHDEKPKAEPSHDAKPKADDGHGEKKVEKAPEKDTHAKPAEKKAH